MKEAWEALYGFLAADATLIGLLGHTSAAPKIVRQQSAQFTKTPAVGYREMTSVKIVDGLPSPRRMLFQIIVKADADRDADDIAERLIELLHGADITSTDVHSYYAEWDDFKEGPYWDEAGNCFRVDTRFGFAIRKTS